MFAIVRDRTAPVGMPAVAFNPTGNCTAEARSLLSYTCVCKYRHARIHTLIHKNKIGKHMHIYMHSLTHSLTYLVIRSFTYALTHSLTHHSLTHSFTHSFTHSPPQMPMTNASARGARRAYMAAISFMDYQVDREP